MANPKVNVESNENKLRERRRMNLSYLAPSLVCLHQFYLLF
ncbi:hypothetical protein [Orenia metallireducens]|nr:hypothetical protein [Orenia metallireducens]